MKLLAISTSPRRGQNTDKLLEIIVDEWVSQGHQAEFVSLSGKDIRPCQGCNVCRKGHTCIINDDISVVLEKMKEAQGIVIGSPTYFYDVNAQCKILIDRSYAVGPLNGNKVGGIVTLAGSLGHSSSVKTLEMFYRVHGISNLGFLGVYAPVEDKPNALEAARALARKVAGAADVMAGLPSGTFDAFRLFSYGTHTF